MCCGTVWIPKCHPVFQPYYQWPKQTALLGPAAWKSGELTQIKYKVLRPSHCQIPTAPTAPFTSEGKRSCGCWEQRSPGAAAGPGQVRGVRRAWAVLGGAHKGEHESFQKTCKCIQKYRYFSTMGYCASLGCQNSYNCYIASYWVEHLEVHLYIRGRVAAITKINLEVWILSQSGLQCLSIMGQ